MGARKAEAQQSKLVCVTKGDGSGNRFYVFAGCISEVYIRGTVT